MSVKDDIIDIIEKTKAFYCVECGKCTSICPLSRVGDYSPEMMVEKSLIDLEEEILFDKRVWSCLTCYRCSEICTFGVDYPRFIRGIREEIVSKGIDNKGICVHGDLLSLMRLQSWGVTKQKRLGWLSKDLKTSDEKGEILYFVGCLPYFDIIFEELNMRTTEIARSTVRILNKSGITPVVMSDEVCCGHDLLWSGEIDAFKRLASINLKNINKSGAKKVIFSCAECYRTFREDYVEYFGELNFEVAHISEFLDELLDEGKIVIESKNEKKLTYHDPCRLGRHLHIYDEPRKVLREIAPIEEMTHNKEDALCCGTSLWTNCNTLSEEIRKERLREAKETGADVLVTACPKCLIHFSCTINRIKELHIDMEDFSVVVEKAIRKSDQK